MAISDMTEGKMKGGTNRGSEGLIINVKPPCPRPPKKKYKTVDTEWVLQPLEYRLAFKCPECSRLIQDFELGTFISEGDNCNKPVICPYCRKKFQLRVKAV